MNLLSAIIQSNVYLLITGLAFMLVFRHIRQFQANRFFLIGGITLSLILPWIHINLPFFNSTPALATLWTAIPTEQPAPVTVAAEAAGSPLILPDLSTVIASIYTLIVILMITVLLYQSIKMLILSRNKQSFRYGNLRIVPINSSSPVYSFFNTVFYPEPVELDKASTQLILDHEQIHALQLHSLDNFLITLVQIVFFYNPIVYIIRKQIRLNHEYIADEATSATDKYFYSETLISHQFKVPGLTLMHSFNQRSYIKKRLTMLSKNKQTIRAGWGYLLILPLIAGMILMSSWSTFAQDQAKKSKEEIAKMAVEKELTKAGFSKADIEEIKLRIDGKTRKNPDVGIEIEEEAQIFQIVEVMPEFQGGGLETFREWTEKNVKYPKKAKKDRAEGTVYVSFIVNRIGEIKNIQIIRSIHPLLDEEVVRVMKSAPAWKPGLQRNRPVNVSFNVPVSISLYKD